MEKLLSDIMIELHVPSFEVAKEFYEDLGFEVVWERLTKETSYRYLVMRRGTSILNFYCGNEEVYNHSFFKRFPKITPRGYAVEIIIPLDDIDLFYASFEKKHKEKIVEPLNQKIVKKDFRIVDPFGFYIRFVERYDWVNGRDKEGNEL